MAELIAFDDRAPVVPDTAFVARTATLIGDVRLGRHSSVFYGAVLRADVDTITIGENTNLQDGVIVHVDPGRPVTIGDDVTVGHGAIVHGATVEDGCLIGIRATVLNDVVVGAGSLIAAGAVVREGTVIPPRSLVAGVPAQVRGQLTDEQAQRVRENSGIYVELAQRHAALDG